MPKLRLVRELSSSLYQDGQGRLAAVVRLPVGARSTGRASGAFGAAGYVALFEIEDNETVTILAIRHQREEDYH